MQQQFRTVLQDFNSYPTKIQKYINEVQRGSPSLQGYISQIQKIISEPSEPIISKILAMRFARDIMIMGRQDVVNKLKRLVPMLVKICSHRLESDDPNRGQSFFYYHPQYISCTKESKKKEIELQGSTFFVLCLESINKWAKWIPINSSGNQSEFSKGYNQLLERGVKFENVFHYYKNSDTEKYKQFNSRFKNTYKVEFFTQSQFDNNSQQSSRQLGSFSSKMSSITPEQIQSSQDIRQYLNNKDLSKNNIKQIDRLFKKTIDLYSNIKDFQHVSKLSKQQKQYMEKFIINYVMLQHKKINFSDFNRNMTTVELQLQQNSQILVEQPSKRMLKGISNSNLRNPAPQANQYQQLLEKQEQSFNRKINFLKKQLEDRLGDLKTIKGKHQAEIQEVKNQYQSRIQLIKKGIIENSGQKTKYLIRENEALKEKMNQLQNREQVGSYYDTSLHHQERQKELELDNLRLGRQIQELKIQNQKLKNMRKTGSSLKQPIRQSNTNPQQIHQLQNLKTTLKKLQSQISTYKSNEQKLDTQMNKKNKKLSNLAQQLKLYKSQLTDQREKHRKQLQKNNKVIRNLEIQVKSYREKILHFEKKIDLKDIQTAQLQEQIRLCKLMDRETNIMLKNINMEERKGTSDLSKLSRSPQNHQFVSPPKMLSSPHQQSKTTPAFNFKYKKYQTLRNRLFAKNKEEWYRLVRCTLKQKDILFKQNQLQIGIIFNKVDINICEAVLFFTNMSEYQMDSLELEGNFGGSVYQHQRDNNQISGVKDKDKRNQEIILGSEFIFCLQSQQQQKISVTVRKQEPITQIYQPIYLHVQFKKNNKNYKHRIIFPSFIFKSIQYCPIRDHIYATAISDGRRQYQDNQIVINPTEQQYYSLKIIASTNIVNQAKCIPMYFPGLQKRPSESEIEKYIGVASVSKLGVFFIVKLQLRKDNIMKIRLIPIHRIFQDSQLHQKQSQLQEQILRDYLSFIEFAFKK